MHGTHRAPQPRRRWLGIPLTAWIVLAVAGVAFAAWLASRQDTAPETISAKSVGTVNIGGLTTAGLFPATVNLTGLSPGTTVETCFTLSVDATAATAPGSTRMFAAARSGALADHLEIEVYNQQDSESGPVGHFNCADETWPALTKNFDGLLSTFPIDYATGLTLFGPQPGGVAWRDIRVVLTLPATAPETASGTSVTLSMALENR